MITLEIDPSWGLYPGTPKRDIMAPQKRRCHQVPSILWTLGKRTTKKSTMQNFFRDRAIAEGIEKLNKTVVALRTPKRNQEFCNSLIDI